MQLDEIPENLAERRLLAITNSHLGSGETIQINGQTLTRSRTSVTSVSRWGDRDVTIFEVPRNFAAPLGRAEVPAFDIDKPRSDDRVGPIRAIIQDQRTHWIPLLGALSGQDFAYRPGWASAPPRPTPPASGANAAPAPGRAVVTTHEDYYQNRLTPGMSGCPILRRNAQTGEVTLQGIVKSTSRSFPESWGANDLQNLILAHRNGGHADSGGPQWAVWNGLTTRIYPQQPRSRLQMDVQGLQQRTGGGGRADNGGGRADNGGGRADNGGDAGLTGQPRSWLELGIYPVMSGVNGRPIVAYRVPVTGSRMPESQRRAAQFERENSDLPGNFYVFAQENMSPLANLLPVSPEVPLVGTDYFNILLERIQFRYRSHRLDAASAQQVARLAEQDIIVMQPDGETCVPTADEISRLAQLEQGLVLDRKLGRIRINLRGPLGEPLRVELDRQGRLLDANGNPKYNFFVPVVEVAPYNIDLTSVFFVDPGRVNRESSTRRRPVFDFNGMGRPQLIDFFQNEAPENLAQIFADGPTVRWSRIGSSTINEVEFGQISYPLVSRVSEGQGGRLCARLNSTPLSADTSGQVSSLRCRLRFSAGE